MDMILLALAVILVTCLWLLIRKPKHPIDQLPGPPTLPFFGNALMYARSNREGFQALMDNCLKYRPLFRTWLTKFVPVVNPISPEHIETILSSTQHIKKSFEYDILSKFLGNGLVTTEVSKWHSRRKLLTPAFHFNILERYIPVFCEKTRILIAKLEAAISANPEGINIVPYITRCALDIICETAMGHAVNAQEGATSEYLSRIQKTEQLIYYRMKRPWLLPDWIFNLTKAGREFDESIKILHDFTDRLIQKRRNEIKTAQMDDTVTETDDDLGRRKKISFLDLLMNVAAKDPTLTEFDIRSEVDTFMFAGHDTTTYGMSWTVYYLSTNPEIQDHCLTELEEIFGTSDRDPTMTDLANMKYIERVIKETMRLRPPAWFIGRQLTKSLKFDGYDAFPPNTVIQINIAGIHRNPDIYPDPEKFDPDRFLPENCVARHPYAYIPFSAGPRNCIGQRFAMLEMKEVISTLLRHFKLESCDPEFYNEAIPRLTLQPMNGVKVRLYARNWNH